MADRFTAVGEHALGIGGAAGDVEPALASIAVQSGSGRVDLFQHGLLDAAVERSADGALVAALKPARRPPLTGRATHRVQFLRVSRSLAFGRKTMPSIVVIRINGDRPRLAFLL